jgi:hypothetical protein
VALVKESAMVRTKRTWLFVGALLYPLLALGPMMVFLSEVVSRGRHWWALGPFLLVVLGVQFAMMQVWRRWWRVQRGRLRADEAGVWIGERCLVRRRGLAHAYVVREGGRCLVRLGRSFRPVDVEVDDEAEGARLVQALRLDAGRSVARYTFTHGRSRDLRKSIGFSSTLLIGLVLVLLPLMTRFPLVALATALFGYAAYLLHLMNLRVHVSVGADGVRLRRPLSRARFIPFAAVAHARMTGKDMELALRSGGSVSMHHNFARQAGKDWLQVHAHRAPEGTTFVQSVQAGMQRHHGEAHAGASLTARGGRRVEVWLRELAALADDPSSFRSAAVPADALWRILDDPSAAATARAGAAAALRSRLDDEGRARLRVVADACAAPRLRVALARIAAGAEDARLHEALEELDDGLKASPPARAPSAPR